MFVRVSVCVLRVCVRGVDFLLEGKNGFGEDKGALLSKECTSLSCIFNFTYLHKEAIESLSCTVIVFGCYSGTATLGEITDFLTFNIVGNT